MKFHIIGNNESLSEILNSYDITLDELKKENKHIRMWNYLIPGTKLKIPVITETMNEDINEIEPFIEDYYPKIKLEEQYYEINEEKKEEENIVEEIEDENDTKNLYNEQNINNNEIEEDNKKIENIKNDNKERILYRYVYPNPMYYYRPIVYVIPRKKQKH